MARDSCAAAMARDTYLGFWSEGGILSMILRRIGFIRALNTWQRALGIIVLPANLHPTLNKYVIIMIEFL